MRPDPSSGHAARPRPFLWFFVFVLTAGLAGCGGCSSGTSVSPKGKGGKEPERLGRDLLNPAISMMQPENLGIESLPEQPAGLLNQWRSLQMKTLGNERLSEPLSDETRKLLESELSPDAVRTAERDDFDVEDVRHIRTSILMKNIVDHVAQGIDGELKRAQAVFEYVTRNIQLVAEEEALSLTPYEILIFGEGTAADRAWIFAELLRQLNQDAVIVKSDSPDGPWFVGAVANRTIHLFDPLRSTPVPTMLRAKTYEIPPASVADLSNPAIWESLSAGSDDKLTAESFENAHLEVIGTSTLWAPRHANLQKVLTGSDSVIISQTLTASGGSSASIINRLSSLESARWTPDRIRVWKHPAARLRGFEVIDNLSERWKPFEAPQPRTVDRQTGTVVFGNFSRLQLKTRTQQLKGQIEFAITGYLRVQLAYRHLQGDLPGEIRELHADAAEDAAFWSAVCQMEQGKFDEAENKLGTYLREAERFAGSRHADHARILLSRCLIQLERSGEAVEVLSSMKSGSPASETAAFLKHALENAEGTQARQENSPPPMSDPPKPGSEESKPPGPAVAEKPKR